MAWIIMVFFVYLATGSDSKNIIGLYIIKYKSQQYKGT